MSKHERNAIDWIGNRYWNGDDFFKLLMDSEQSADWDFDGDVTFKIPEHVAWQINEFSLAEGFPCFSAVFANKLLEFCDKIV